MDKATRIMRAAERAKDPQARVAWGISGFPKGLKDQFAGLCKMQGKRVPDVLEYLVARYIREERMAMATGER